MLRNGGIRAPMASLGQVRTRQRRDGPPNRPQNSSAIVRSNAAVSSGVVLTAHSRSITSV